MNHHQAFNLSILLLFAFLANLPLGYLREATAKYSLRWFVLIHLSIPFIIALRLTQGIGWNAVPFSISFAVIGQLVGGRIRRGKTP